MLLPELFSFTCYKKTTTFHRLTTYRNTKRKTHYQIKKITIYNNNNDNNNHYYQKKTKYKNNNNNRSLRC